MPTIFLSYRRQDSAGHAGWLFDELERVYGRKQLFRDIDSIRPGESFPDVLDEHLNICDVMLVIIGPRWLTIEDEHGVRRLQDPTDILRLEVSSALARDDVRVIPVLVQGGEVPSADDLPSDLRSLAYRQAVELRDARRKDDVRHLVEVIGPPRRRWLQLVASRTTARLAGLAVVALALVILAVTLVEPEARTAPPPTPTSGEGEWRINFQAANAEVPDGYLVDFGQPFGDRIGANQGEGLRYGWVEPGTSTPKDMTAHARDRGESPDVPQLLDTLVHFRNRNPATRQIDLASWELEVPDGRYLVTVSVGDRGETTHTVIAEGVPVITDFRSLPGRNYENNTVPVEVTDGRLTLDSPPDRVSKINYVEVVALP